MKRSLPLYLALLSVLLAVPSFADDAGTAPAAVAAPAGPTISAAAPVVTPAPAAPGAPDIGANPGGFAKDVWDAFETKDWGHLLFFGITLLVFVLRKFVGPKFPVLLTTPGSVAMNFALAFGGMLATSWPAGTKITPHAIMTAVYGGFIAAGGWTIVKNLWEHFSQKGANPAQPVAPAPPPPAKPA